MFETIFFQNYRNSEFVQYIKNALDIISSYNPDELGVNEPYENAGNKFLSLESLFKQGRGSDITSELQELDKRRDNAIIGITGFVECYSYHFDEEKQLSAERLIESMEIYGTGLSRLAYQSETSVISSILRKWGKDEDLKNAIATLGLTEWVEELYEANTLFDKRFLARIKEQAHDPEISVATLRKEVTELFRILQDHINAHAIISKDPKYDAVIKEINTLTESYNRTAIDRSTSTGNDVSTNDSNPSEEEVN